jgi:carotenoid cleavage dioxygenase
MSALGYEGWVRGLRPVRDEGEHGDAPCVAGAIPSDLRGALYRCGPSQRVLPPQGEGALHLFDGDGLVHKIDLRDGRARHASRFVRTASFVLEQRAGVFNQDCLGVRAPSPVRGVPMRQQQNTHVIAHANRLFALVESAAPVEIAFDSLRRLGEHDFGLGLAGRPLAAHPKIDAATGELFAHTSYPLAPYLQLHKIDAAGRAAWSVGVELPFPAWVHDIALTSKYVVVPLSPVAIDVRQVDGRWIPTDPYAVREGEPLRWLVCSREDGRVVARFESREAGAVVHCGRAVEDGDDLVVEAVTYDRPAAYLQWLKVARSGGWVPGAHARYARHRLHGGKASADATILVERSSEFPRVDDRLVGRDARYTYLAVGGERADSRAPAAWNRIAKLDAHRDSFEEHALPEDTWAGEPVFAPRVGAAGEDDGYVLVVAYDARDDASLLYVLDARAIAGAPVAVVSLPSRVPFGFHGSFVS